MENDFITIAEAAELSGKSDIDIMRLLKDRLQSSGVSVESVMRREQREKGIMLLVNKAFLFQEPPESSQDLKDSKQEYEESNELLKAKDEMIATLQRIIEIKDRQMEDLGKKIDELIERDRETNILLKGLQDRIFLLEDSRENSAQEEKPDKQKTS